MSAEILNRSGNLRGRPGEPHLPGTWSRPSRESRTTLTDRETEALRLAALGLTEQGIARQMGMAPGTVRDALERARRVLRARNTTHAVVLALAAGQLDLEGVA